MYDCIFRETKEIKEKKTKKFFRYKYSYGFRRSNSLSYVTTLKMHTALLTSQSSALSPPASAALP